jgi:hypothetical protein
MNKALVSSVIICFLVAQTPRRFGFTIDLDTTGGFSGRGRGGITIEWNGDVRAARQGKRSESSCASKLTAEELASLSDAVASAQRNPWPASFNAANDNGCCDRFRYTLTLSLPDADPAKAGRTFTTMWHEPVNDRLPEDIARIRQIAVSALERALLRCSRSLPPR